MKLIEHLRNLSYMELSDLAQAGEGNGTISEPLRKRVISMTNNGLLELFTKFAILNKELILHTQAGLNRYFLRIEHAVTDPTVGPIKYIIDTMDDPFVGDLIRLDSIRDSTDRPIWTNMPDQLDCDNLFKMTAFDTLYVQNPAQVLKLYYRAKHPELSIDADPSEVDINLPPLYEQALRSYVGWKVYSGQKGQDSQLKAQQLEMVYNSQLNNLTDVNITNEFTPDDFNEKFASRGFV